MFCLKLENVTSPILLQMRDSHCQCHATSLDLRSVFRLASFILRSAVSVTNLLLTKNLVVDLQESRYLIRFRTFFKMFSEISFDSIDPLFRDCVE